MSRPPCPDWAALALVCRETGPGLGDRNRDAAAAAAAAARWDAALHHLDGGCQDCRRQALAADPTLVFRRLPRIELDAAAEAAEVAAARQAVAAMRNASDHLAVRARRSLGSLGSPGSPRAAFPSRTAGPLRWSLAAGLTGMALLVGADRAAWRGAAAPPATPASAAAAARLAVTTAASAAGASASSPSSPSSMSAASRSDRARLAGMSDLLAPASQFVAARGGLPVALPAADRSAIEGLDRPGARVYRLDGPHMSVVMIVDDKLDV